MAIPVTTALSVHGIWQKLNNLIGIPHKHKKLYPRSPKVEFSSINLYNTMLIVSYICLVYN